MTVASGGCRPRDWHPLADGDPVPGDPAAIRDEVAHMRRFAQALRDQARELKTIAAGEDLKGHYADTLRDQACDLELRLRQTAERYEHVHGHLTCWAAELEDFQTTSATLLRRARDTDHRDPHDSHDSDDPLLPLRQALARLTQERDHRASHYAHRINHSCDDPLHDSVWERIDDDIDAVLNDVWCERLFELASWVVTFVGIAALFFTPAGWIVDLALDLTVMLAAKDVLALSAGEGSWFDIGMDVVGFLTMASGAGAFTMLTKIHVATKTAAAAAAAETAAGDLLEESRPVLDRTYRVTSRAHSTKASRTAARRLRSQLLATARRAGRNAGQAESERAVAEATKREVFSFGGDREAAGASKDIDRMRGAYADSDEVQRASRHAIVWKAGFKASWMIGSGTDGADKLLGHSDLFRKKPSYAPYEAYKGRFRSAVGSGW